MRQLFYLGQWFVRARLFGRKAPLQTVLFITDKCNLRCKHCSVYGSAGYRQRKFDDILQDMRESYKAGSRFIDLEGGEPTLWKEDGKTINDIIDAALRMGFFSITVTTNAQQDFSWIHPDSIWVSMDGVGEYHERVRGEGTFARLEENIRKSGKKHICVNMVVNSLNWESLDAAMEYARSNEAIEQISINFHTPYPGTEYLMLPVEKKVELIDKVLEYKKKGYPVMNSRSGLRRMKRNALGEMKLGKECFVTNFIYPDGSRGLCVGYGTDKCAQCGFCMAGEMSSVFHFCPDTIFAGFKLRM
ncbi:MAG: radical SAM protein [Bacteroidales bacterium]|nr:radical SAM protein [Candidatus Cryptobacteroides onthequi]